MRFRNEFLVSLGLGVLIVSRLVLKHQMQSYVKVSIIHVPLHFGGERSHGKPDRARVIRKVLFAGGDEFLLGLGRIVLQREIDIVAQHGLGLFGCLGL